MIRILLADDHSIFRAGLKKILADQGDMLIAGEVDHGDRVIPALQREEWNLLVLDVSMPGKGSLEIITHARRVKPELPILLLTMHRDHLMAARFLKAGARGYLTKDCGLDQLLLAIRKVASGRRCIDEELNDLIFDQLDGGDDAPLHTRLSHREFTVLCSIASGLTVTRIADELALSVSAISSYRNRLLAKLGLENNAQLTRYALEHHLVK
ncbi:MAG: response regulator transcription factor [Magnetococcales bacterium]|nr:response regulator transcription factor [Magnetococcales bacterium]MBF0157686.1 response regulator transcription factor [Magnetococcales bacterium]